MFIGSAEDEPVRFSPIRPAPIGSVITPKTWGMFANSAIGRVAWDAPVPSVNMRFTRCDTKAFAIVVALAWAPVAFW